MDEFHELQRQGLITYHLLSTLFAPGDVVVDRSGPQHGLLRMVSTQYVCSKCPGLQISTQYVDYDGAAYGLEDRPLRVKPFKGSQPIEQLKYIPLSLLPEGDALVQRLITRGLRATVLNQAGYMMHAGFAEFGIVELPVERYVSIGAVIPCGTDNCRSKGGFALIQTAIPSMAGPSACITCQRNCSLTQVRILQGSSMLLD